MGKLLKVICCVLCMAVCLQGEANMPSRQIDSLLNQANGERKANQVSLQSGRTLSPDLQNLQQNFKLVLFFRSTCPHCHHFVPVLKDFVNYYHLRLSAYSTDGPSIDGIQSQKMSANEYKDYFVQGGFRAVVPALFLQNIHTGQTYAVLFGEATPGQLALRMNQLLKHIQEKEDQANA